MTSGSWREWEKTEQHGSRRRKRGTARQRAWWAADRLGLIMVSMGSEIGLSAIRRQEGLTPLTFRESRISQAVSVSIFRRQGGKQKK